MTQSMYEEYKRKMDSFGEKDFKVLVGNENGRNIFKNFRFEKYSLLAKTKVENEPYDYRQDVVLKEVDGDRLTVQGLQTLVDLIERPQVGKLAKNYLIL